MARLTLDPDRTPLPERIAEPLRTVARDQLFVAGGQLASGAGNLVFALAMARILPPDAFARLAAFLALYLLLFVLTGSLAAGSALKPGLADTVRPRLWRIGVAASLGVIVLRAPLSALLGIPEGLVLALGVAAPAAGVLAVERGKLYGTSGHRRVVASLAAEPLIRLSLAVALAVAVGASGAAMGVAIAGWAALAVAAPEQVGPRWTSLSRRLLREPEADLLQLPASGGAGEGGAGEITLSTKPAVVTFLLLALLMNQDLLFANRLLDDPDAARFAVLSVLGGMAAFATTTVPLVLLGHGSRRDALKTAVLTASGLGAAAVLVVLTAPEFWVSLAFGARYESVGPLAAPYLVAMGFFGVGRVFAAHLSSVGRGRVAVWVLCSALFAQAVGIVAFARTAAAVTVVTLSVMAAYTIVLAAIHLLGTRSDGPLTERLRRGADGAGRGLTRAWTASRPGLERAGAGIRRAAGSAWAATRTRTAAAAVVARRRAPVVAETGRRNAVRAADVLQRESVRTLEVVRRRAPEVRGDLKAWVKRIRADRVLTTVAVLTVVALLVRLLVPRSIWLDEAIAVAQAKLPFGQMIERLRFTDVHPPFHEMLMWVTVRVLGTGELAVRLPSVVAGTALIPLLFVVGRELYNRSVGLVAAMLATFAPFLVWYSQETRMYSLFALFAVATVWGQVRVVRYGGRKDWFLYGASTALLLWTHYFAILHIVVQQLAFAYVAWDRHRRGEDPRPLLRGWATTGLCVGLAMMPLVPILRDQLVAYGNRQTSFDDVPTRAGGALDPGQERLSVYAVLANLVWAIWGYHSDTTMAQIVALWPLGMFFLLFLLGRGRSRTSTLLAALVAGPVAVLFVIGLYNRNLFELRYFAGVVPMLVLLLSRTVTASFRGRGTRAVATLAVVGTLVVGLVDQQTNGANPRIYDFRGALERVSEVARPSDEFLYQPYYLEPVIDYYAPDISSRRLSDDLPRPEDGGVILLASFLDNKAISGQAGRALHTLEERYGEPEEFRYPRVRVWVFG